MLPHFSRGTSYPERGLPGRSGLARRVASTQSRRNWTPGTAAGRMPTLRWNSISVGPRGDAKSFRCVLALIIRSLVSRARHSVRAVFEADPARRGLTRPTVPRASDEPFILSCSLLPIEPLPCRRAWTASSWRRRDFDVLVIENGKGEFEDEDEDDKIRGFERMSTAKRSLTPSAVPASDSSLPRSQQMPAAQCRFCPANSRPWHWRRQS